MKVEMFTPPGMGIPAETRVGFVFRAGHDVSDEPRDDRGRWTDAGGADGGDSEDVSGTGITGRWENFAYAVIAGSGKTPIPATDAPDFNAWFAGSKFSNQKGEPKAFYHQTSKTNAAAILKTGFELGHSRALMSDDTMPDGIFFMPTPTDIGLGSAEEKDKAFVPAYLSAKNPLEVKDRDQLEKYLSADKTWLDLKDESRRIEHDAAAQADADWEAMKGKPRGPELTQALQESQAKLEAAAKLVKEVATKARAEATKFLKERGFDGLRMLDDQGGLFGNKHITTMVIFDPRQARTVFQPGERKRKQFDPASLRLDTLIIAKHLGLNHIEFSDRLQWIDRDGELVLCTVRHHRNSGRIVVFAEAMEALYGEKASDKLVELLRAGHDVSDEPRDDHGRWTDAGGGDGEGDTVGGAEFVSPNVQSNLDLHQAIAALHSKQQASLRQASDQIDRELKLPGDHHDVVGAWQDGAENSVADFHHTSKWTDWDRLKLSASMKGHLADQKSVLVFQEQQNRKPRETVTVKSPHYSGHLLVEVNPTGNELRRLAKEAEQRVLIDADGNLYAWPAGNAIHAYVADQLGLDERHEDIWHLYNGKLISSRYLDETVTQAGQHRDMEREAAQEVTDKLASLEGNAALLSFEAQGDLATIHQNLLSDGVAFHTLVPHAKGATIYVAALGTPAEVKATVKAVDKAAQRYDSKITYRKGRGELIGDLEGSGSDREQRDRARSIYERNIRESPVHNAEAVWQSIRDSRGKASDQEVASKAFRSGSTLLQASFSS